MNGIYCSRFYHERQYRVRQILKIDKDTYIRLLQTVVVPPAGAKTHPTPPFRSDGLRSSSVSSPTSLQSADTNLALVPMPRALPQPQPHSPPQPHHSPHFAHQTQPFHPGHTQNPTPNPIPVPGLHYPQPIPIQGPSSSASIQSQDASLHQMIASLNSMLGNAKHENLSLRNQLASIQSAHQNLQSTYQSVQSEHQGLQSEHQSLQSIHQSLQSNHQSLQSNHQSLQSTHQNLQQMLQQDRRKAALMLNTYNAKHRALLQSEKAKQDEIVRLNAQVEQTDGRKEELESELTRVRGEFDEWRARRDSSSSSGSGWEEEMRKKEEMHTWERRIWEDRVKRKDQELEGTVTFLTLPFDLEECLSTSTDELSRSNKLVASRSQDYLILKSLVKSCTELREQVGNSNVVERLDQLGTEMQALAEKMRADMLGALCFETTKGEAQTAVKSQGAREMNTEPEVVDLTQEPPMGLTGGAELDGGRPSKRQRTLGPESNSDSDVIINELP
ncbi:hypothetical protein V5O48_015192 [Marasmius crinis-equi]|uniref:SWI5-dependent HO expression protein 3 n=1 Tax=Marasmius crinis-equi TaxID=585013 RepID=A0ABR3EV76_9AGAR